MANVNVLCGMWKVWVSLYLLIVNAKVLCGMWDVWVSIDLLIDEMNNYIVRSYRDVIVITKFATRRASKEHSIVMY